MKKALKITSLLLIVLVLSLGLVSCKHKEPSDHTPVGDWLSDENYHWHACEKEKCENAGDKAEHTYDNACDKDCNVCGAERTPAAHVYTNACDKDCNVCGVTRTPSAHVYDNACDAKCNVCNAERTPSAHVYDNACDAKCNVCNAERTPSAHVYDNACDAKCNVCNAERTPSAHVYDNDCDTKCNVCNAERTVGAHVYDNACDTKCNKCNAERTITHTYDNACDAKCNVCNAERTPADHVYDNACDASCNVCSATRTVGAHQYDDDCDATCNICSATRQVTHTFDQCVEEDEYIKAAATATTKKQYWKSCECGAKSDTEYFEVDKLLVNLEIVNDISKVYDGTPVSEPEIEFDGVGGECFEYWQGGTKLPGRPTNAGTYKVVVIIYETETHAADRVEAEFTIAKKVLSNLTFSVVYNGGTYHGNIVVPSGVVAGDEFLVDIDLYNKNVGTYTCYSTDKDTSTCWEDISYGGADYENYEIDRATTMVIVTPKVLSGLSVDLTYDGTKYFEVPLGVANGILAGDVADGIKVCITFASKNVGAAVTVAGLDADDGDNFTNYELDLTTCTANIVPKVLNITHDFVYNALDVRQDPLTVADGIIAGDDVLIAAMFEFADVGSDVLTGEDAPYLDGTDCDNYILGTFDLNIIRKVVTFKTGVSTEFNCPYDSNNEFLKILLVSDIDGYEGSGALLRLKLTTPSKNVGIYEDVTVEGADKEALNYDFSQLDYTVKINKSPLCAYFVYEYGSIGTNIRIKLDSSNTGNGDDREGVLDNDEVYADIILPHANVDFEIFPDLVTLSGEDAGNYEYFEFTVQITKKKLTNLHLYITEDTYTSGVITLLPKDGIVAGEVVKITITNVNDQDFWEGFYIDMQLSDGTAYRNETIAFVESGDYANYEFATYDDGNGNQIVGIVECIAECDVQFDGSCSCGGHLTPGIVNSSNIYTSKPSAIGWTDGVYKIINTEAGYWYIDREMEYAVITGVYDAEGNMVPVSQSGFYAEEGVYYVHLESASGTALTEAKGLRFYFSYTLYNTASSGYYYESNNINGEAGGEYYFKVTADMSWGSSLGIFDENEDEHESSKYTIKVYDSSFNEIADVRYEDREDLYFGEDDEGVSGMDIYIVVIPTENIEFYIGIY